MRNPWPAVLAVLALLALLAYGGDNSDKGGFFKVDPDSITISGERKDMNDPKVIEGFCPSPADPEISLRAYVASQTSRTVTRNAFDFEMGLVFSYRVETGFPRTDKAQEARGSEPYAAQWGDPNPLKTEYRVQASVRFSAPRQWTATVTEYVIRCEYYNKTSGELVGSTTVTVTTAKDVRGEGWQSGERSCDLLILDTADSGEYACTLTVPWYGKETVEPGDFGAQYWENVPSVDQFGSYEMTVTHEYLEGAGGSLRFLQMSGL